MPDTLKPWEQFKNVKPWDLEWADEEPTQPEVAPHNVTPIGPSETIPVGDQGPGGGFSIGQTTPPIAPTTIGRQVDLPSANLTKPVLEFFPKATPEQLGQLLSIPTAKGLPSYKPMAIAAGVEHAAADTANFFTSPLGIATLGLGALPKAIQRLTALAFAGTMAKDVPEIAKQLGTELGKPEDQRDYQKISELTANAAANTAFAGLGVKHGLAEPVAETLGAIPREHIANVVPESLQLENATTRNQNQLQTGTQAIPEGSQRITPMDEAQSTSASTSWLKSIEGNDIEAGRNAEKELLGESKKGPSVQQVVLANPNRAGGEVRTPGGNVEQIEKAVETIGTRSPQEWERARQQIEESGTTPAREAFLSAPQTSRGPLVEAFRQLQNVSDAKQAALGARTLLGVLSKEKRPEVRQEITNQIKDINYARNYGHEIGRAT